MKRIYVIITILLISLPTVSFAQTRGQVPPGQPTKQEIEKAKRRIEQRKQEYIGVFLTTLGADDFQKQIVKQYLESYSDERVKLMSADYSRLEERERAYKNLEDTHFTDLEGMISENDMNAIKDFITGDFDEKKAKKANKKRKKNKN